MGNFHLISNKKIVFFDGECNLCDSWVVFLISHDIDNKLHFAQLQADESISILESKNYNALELKSIVFLDNGEISFKSNAVLNIFNNLPVPYRFVSIFRWVPKFLRDFVYDLIATNRHRLWKKQSQCLIPTKEVKKKFLFNV